MVSTRPRRAAAAAAASVESTNASSKPAAARQEGARKNTRTRNPPKPMYDTSMPAPKPKQQPRTSSKATTASKRASKTPTKKQQQTKPSSKSSNNNNKRRKTLPQYLDCPDLTTTDKRVWIASATLQDIKLATKTRKPPWYRARHYLVQVPSPQQRELVYERAAAALQAWEEDLLPDYGGRSWKVVVKVSDPIVVGAANNNNKAATKKSGSQYKPFFVWHTDGLLELAAWPHIVDKIPVPPTFPGYSATGERQKPKPKVATPPPAPVEGAAAPTEEDAHNEEDEDSEEEEEEEPQSAEQLQQTSLQERPATPISELAYQERWRVPLPHVSIKWISPLRNQTFYSRKAAWEFAVQLCKQEISIDKMLSGIGARGQLLQINPKRGGLTRQAVLQAGNLRFERDGLWVVGQEEAWQIERLQQQQQVLEQQKKQPQLKQPPSCDSSSSNTKPLTGLAFYLQSQRKSHQIRRMEELRQEARLQKRARKMALGSMITEIVDLSTPSPSPVAATSSSSSAVVADLKAAPAVASAVSAAAGSATVADSPAMAGTVAVKPSPPTTANALPCAKGGDDSVPLTNSETTTPCNDAKKVAATKVSNDDDDSEKKPAAIPTPPSPTAVASSSSLDNNSQKKKRPSGDDDSKKVSFTLRQADNELRVLWKNLSEEERQSWTARAKAASAAATKTTTSSTPAQQPTSTPAASKPLTVTAGRVTPPAAAAANGGTGSASSSSAAAVAAVAPIVSPGDETTTARPIVSPLPPHETTSSSAAKAPATTASKQKSTCAKQQEGTNSSIVPSVSLKPGPSSKWRMSEEQIRLCYMESVNHFDQIMRTVKARDLTRELQDGFDLLRERGRGRYDMELPVFDTPAFNFLTDGKKTPWMPVVKAILGDDCVLIHKGVFLSLQGAEGQVYHQDGTHLNSQHQKPCHAVNVFVPLVDLTTQGTEFCLGSHILGFEDYDRDFCETPQVSAGTPVIFDYRLGHKGLANSTDDIRPVVYCTYARGADGKEFRDSVNFSRKRYRRIGDLVDKVPTREERMRERAATVQAQAVERAIAASLADSNNA